MATTTRERSPKTRRPNALMIRTSPAWDTWMDRFCGLTRRTRSNLVEEALASYAERLDFAPPPPRV